MVGCISRGCHWEGLSTALPMPVLEYMKYQQSHFYRKTSNVIHQVVGVTYFPGQETRHY